MTQTENSQNPTQDQEMQNQAEVNIDVADEISPDSAIDSDQDPSEESDGEVKDAEAQNAQPENEEPKETLVLSPVGEIVWNGVSIAKLLPKQNVLYPKFELIGPELNQEETAKIVSERLDSWLVETIRTDLAPLFRLKRAIEFVQPIVPIVEIVSKSSDEKSDSAAQSPTIEISETIAETDVANENIEAETIDVAQNDVNKKPNQSKPQKPVRAAPKELAPQAKEIAQLVFDNCGILDRTNLADKITALSQDNRRELRNAGIKFGRNAIYLPMLLKPKSARLNAILSALSKSDNNDIDPLLPPIGVTSFEATEEREASDYLVCGFQKLGTRAIRLDIVDRVIDALFDAAKEAKGAFVLPLSVVSLLGVSNDAANSVVKALGWSCEEGEDGVKKWRFKRAPVYKKSEHNKRPPTNTAANEKSSRPENKNFAPRNQGFKKKSKDKGEKMRAPRDYSARPTRSVEDSPFAILAGLKAELQNKKD